MAKTESSDHQSLFAEACRVGNLERVRELLLDHRDIDVNAVDDEGWTGLLLACDNGHADVVHAL